MLKIHQKPFGGRAPGGGREGRRGRKNRTEERVEGRAPQPDFLTTPLMPCRLK